MNDVVIDITRLLGRFLKRRLPTGVDRVSQEYIRYFCKRAQAIVRILGRTLVFNDQDSQALFQILLASDFRLRARLVLLVSKRFFSFEKVPAPRGKFLFNTGHSGLEREDYAQHLAHLEVKPIFFIHDLIPITHPQYCRAGEKEKHIARMTTTLQLAKAVIANSRFTLDRLHFFAQQQSLKVPPSTVAMLAPAELPLTNEMRPMAEPYFVILGTIEPRKNHALLFKVWLELAEQNPNKTPKLLIIGQRGWDIQQLMDGLQQSALLSANIVELARCSDSELANYLTHAQALLFPSFVEGFGMPLVEALSLGVPVIVSDIEAFHEIAGSIPEYLDPMDVDAWVRIIDKYTDLNSPDRLAQIERMRDYKVATWAQHFERVESLLEKLQ